MPTDTKKPSEKQIKFYLEMLQRAEEAKADIPEDYTEETKDIGRMELSSRIDELLELTDKPASAGQKKYIRSLQKEIGRHDYKEREIKALMSREASNIIEELKDELEWGDDEDEEDDDDFDAEAPFGEDDEDEAENGSLEL